MHNIPVHECICSSKFIQCKNGTDYYMCELCGYRWGEECIHRPCNVLANDKDRMEIEKYFRIVKRKGPWGTTHYEIAALIQFDSREEAYEYLKKLVSDIESISQAKGTDSPIVAQKGE